jgi:hypothetical protein
MSAHVMALIVYWLAVLATGLPFVMIYFAYRRTLLGKRLMAQQVLAQEGVLESYLNAFGRTALASPGQNPSAKEVVDALFNFYYSTGSYLFGIGMNLLVAIGVSICIAVAAHIPLLNLAPGLAQLAGKIPPTLAFSFVGAYIWSLYDLLKRYRFVDLTPAAFQFSWLRLLTACVVGPLISAGATDGLKNLIAFSVGMLPLQAVFEYFADLASKQMGKTITQKQACPPDLYKLQGMTLDSINRMEERRVDSAATLAYADPIKLFLKTEIEWLVIIDVINQALLYNYVGDKLAILPPLGIRGSIEAAIIYQRLRFGHQAEKDEANALIAKLKDKLGLSQEETLNLIRTVWEDGQVRLLSHLFGDSFASNEKAKGAVAIDETAVHSTAGDDKAKGASG